MKYGNDLVYPWLTFRFSTIENRPNDFAGRVAEIVEFDI